MRSSSANRRQFRFVVIAVFAIIALALLLLHSLFRLGLVRAAAPKTASPIEIVEETVTLTSSDTKTWTHYDEFHSELPYCGPTFKVGPELDGSPGVITSGFKHLYDKGAVVFGCPERHNWNYRGTVWFDLSEIVAKAPPLHVYVKSATLSFKSLDSVECAGGLLIAQTDWLKGYPENELVPGDFIAKTGSCGSGRCTFDVATVVNNWVKGEEHGGYANYGFVIRGDREGPNNDNDVCMMRYGEFTLVLTYKYDKTPSVLYVPKPESPIITVNPSVLSTRKNVALAANGGVASASSSTPGYAPSGANDGDEKGLNFGKDGYWSSAAAGFPAWLQIDFADSKTVNEVDVFTTQDNYTSPVDPTDKFTFTKYGLSGFEVQYWNGSWMTISGGNVTGNNLVWRRFTFAPINTSRIRVLTHSSPDGYSRLTEVEAWTP